MRQPGEPPASAPQPLYERTYDELSVRVRRDWRAGSRLPSERALCELLGVSRLTVRRALSLLQRDGLVQRGGTGRGWQTSDTGGQGDPGKLVSFSELAFGRGLTPSAVVLLERVREASMSEGDVLRIAPGASLFDLERLRLLDGIPVAVDSAQLPLSRAPFLTAVDFETASLHETLEQNGVRPTIADYTVAVTEADERLAGLLGVTVGRGMLTASNVTYLDTGDPIEIGRIIYRPDRYRLQTRFVRSSNRPPRHPSRPHANPGTPPGFDQ